MTIVSALALATIVCIAEARRAAAQELSLRPGAAVPELVTSRSPTARPKLFLSCPKPCFDNYLRQELSYFDFVRDPRLADFTLLVVRQPAGNGGERFSATLFPSASMPARIPVARSFVAAPGAPAHESRRHLRQALLRELQQALVGTPYESAFELNLPRRDEKALGALLDPWNYWVIAPEVKGEGEGGSAYYFMDLTGTLTLRRITEATKLRLRFAYLRRLSSYRLEDRSRINGDVHGWEVRPIYARSLGTHWALGGTATVRANQFENLEGHMNGGPLVEFNVFPYTSNASEQLRFAYQVGAWANWYTEPNQANAVRELRPYHALSVIADVNHAFGSVQWVGQINSFLDQPEHYRLSTGALLGLRLFEGLAINVEGQAALVRDQLSLRRRPVTDNELLLWTAQQATEYTFQVKFGLSYTFGSVYNTIVNPRFGRVDLQEE